MLMDVNPLKVIFESFADSIAAAPDQQAPETTTLPPAHTTLEWDPDEDNLADTGPSVKALDLVEILDGLFWLIQNIVQNHHTTTKETHPPSETADCRHQATRMVEHLIQYSRTGSNALTPVNLASESITFNMFFKYASRNTPNLFEVLSQYLYNLFFIGDTMINTSTQRFTLPGVSSVPVLTSQSAILTPENLAMVSWFLPPEKTTPTLTSLYTGSEHGFSMSQFEVHVCKYPAPTLLLLTVERLKTGISVKNNRRRQSISFDTTSLRHRHSISSHSAPYNAQSAIDGTRSSPTAGPVSSSAAESVLSTILDNVPMVTADPSETEPAAPETLRERLVVLGAYVSVPWKASKSGWGNDSCAVFELSPSFEVFPAAQKSLSRVNPVNSHYIHFLKNAGVGFGGQASESCLLYMDDNLRYGSYKQDFAGGNVYMRAGEPRQSGFEIDFEVVECEVWGLGGTEASARQQKEWEFERREANRRASVQLRGKNGEQDIDRDLLVRIALRALSPFCCNGLVLI